MRAIRAQYENKRENSLIANKACAALKSLARNYDKDEFELACKRSLEIASPSVKSVKSILRTGLFRLVRDTEIPQVSFPTHQNVRGSSYYQQGDQ